MMNKESKEQVGLIAARADSISSPFLNLDFMDTIVISCQRILMSKPVSNVFVMLFFYQKWRNEL
jgi:hypothetical protein